MKINVIGLGYIGLPTALTMSINGFDVVGTDYNEQLINTLNSGKLTFEEKGLEDLFDRANKSGIKYTTKYQKSDVYIIAVPTPYDKISKKIDCVYVISAVKEVLKHCEEGAIIVIESTISPGTIDKYVRPIVSSSNLKNIHLAHAPERIIPGNMIYELAHNSRTIGVDDREIGEKIASIYRKITFGEVVITSIKNAEMTKVVENTFRAVNIAFANELAKICDYDGMDVYEIIKICNLHPRVNILNPGPGVGGHCISVDPWFLVGDYPTLTSVIWDSMKVNDSMPEYVLNKICKIAEEKGINDPSRIGLYGLTYKENVDDVRESPTLQLLECQKNHLANPLKVYDPFVKNDIVPNQYHDFDNFLKDTDLVVIMVKHDEIKNNMEKLKDKVVFDTQNICNIDGCYKL